MEWYNKFKVGQRVRVVKKISSWRLPGNASTTWVDDMDKTIGKTYKIKSIKREVGYELCTKKDTYYEHNYWYPMESLCGINIKGEQLLFNFMIQ